MVIKTKILASNCQTEVEEVTREPSETQFIDLPADQATLNLTHVQQRLKDIDATTHGCKLNLSGAENTETNTLDDYTEVTGHSGKMQWGQKTGRRRHWREKWVTQIASDSSSGEISPSSPGFLSEPSSFGVTRGADMESFRRWTETWRRSGELTRIEKTVTQFAPPSENEPTPQNDTDEEAWGALDRVETWVQRVEMYDSTMRRVETKFGLDERIPSASRRWRTREEFVGNVRTSIHFEERKGEEIRTEFQEFLRCGGVRTIRTVRLKDGETWKDSWLVDSDGSQSGQKEGVNIRQVHWSEKWRKKDDDEEYIKTEAAGDGGWKKGTIERTTHDSDGVIRRYGARWTRTRKQAEQSNSCESPATTIEEEDADTWWAEECADHPVNSWGCKIRRTRSFATSQTDDLPAISSGIEEVLITNVNGLTAMNDSFGICTKANRCTTHIEKWRSNGSERDSRKRSIMEKWNSQSVIEELEENGHSETKKIGTDEAWGENWCNVSKLNHNDQTNETSLKEVVNFVDKWWIESSSNKWGKKKFSDMQNGDTFEEKWYENGQEKQVDRWRIKKDGSRRGTKFGERWDPVQQAKISWQEEWGEKHGCERWIDKKWTQEGCDFTKSWGELTGDRGENEHWFEKWHSGGGDEFNERYEVDDEGNTQTTTRGLTIREGDVVNYYMNSHGECPKTGEKWAHKEGETTPYNKWVEKWSNRIDRNYCFKSGRNPQGDEWTENWEEEFVPDLDGMPRRVKTKAFKHGKNAMNQEWYEEWVETEKSKFAKKKGENPVTAEAWEEEWGESWDEENGLQKWTNKWAQAGADRWGQSWGDRYEEDGRHHKWVEEWNKDGIRNVEVPYITALQVEKQGFGFERDVTNGQVPVDRLGLRVLKTGTTIAGLICEDGVVLGADTRATSGGMVAEANAFKLHYISENIWCAGAGVSADLEHVTMNLKAEITLFSKQVGRMPRVQTVVSRLCQHLNKYQGQIVTALICGGINPTGEAELTYIDPSGYTHSGPFMAMGSGGYYAKTVLESMYKDGLTVEDGEKIIASSVEAGIMNDLASGTQVDVVIIKKSDPTHPILKKAILEPVKHQKVPIPPRPVQTQTVVLREERRPISEFHP